MPPVFAAANIFVPVERALTYGDYLVSLRRPALDVHGDKAAGIFGEVIGGIVAIADGGDLELELDEPGIEKLKEQVIGPLAVDLVSSKSSLWRPCMMPAAAARSPMRLYSSAARFTSSMVGFFGPFRLGTIICATPRSFVQAMRSS